jgi:8-oxo-dGTP pyrophosphatase MutT (NUDIX family)
MNFPLDPLLLAPLVTPGGRNPTATPGYRPASVSLLLFAHPQPHLLAIQKTDTEGYPWRNQVALPGGHRDAGDASALDTALRELEEELGIRPGQVAMVGSLGRFQTIARREVEAFLGIWDGSGPVRYDATEIARVLKIPVADLARTHCERHYAGRLPDVRELLYPYRDVIIWGLTAKILHRFLERLLPLVQAGTGACPPAVSAAPGAV